MGGKIKGSNAERELVSMFWGNNWAAIRVAGSGMQKWPAPDVIASNGQQTFVVECKSTKKPQQYLRKEQMDQLKEFARVFKATPLVGVKFSTDWHFFSPEDLELTPSGEFVVNAELIEKKGKKFEEIFRQEYKAPP